MSLPHGGSATARAGPGRSPSNNHKAAPKLRAVRRTPVAKRQTRHCRVPTGDRTGRNVMTARHALLLVAAAGLMLAAGPAVAQTIPQTPAEVARPGGKVPGNPKVSLVKVADGFNDPVGVSVAGDDSGCIFV